MTNEERWVAFIAELRAYIEEHSLGPLKHTTLRNQVVYYRRKMRDDTLDKEKAEELERVLGMRDLRADLGCVVRLWCRLWSSMLSISCCIAIITCLKVDWASSIDGFLLRPSESYGSIKDFNMQSI
ncbi:MAG: helicase associated domain-containing protein [Prevotellaceae bacterium]|nr:helicase associated domain-containing protein [Candidatus Faecinaster equi]